ncbi:fused MFS/spermidine synthase [Acinetobacter lwoffii]|uniref:fused MFS/spermidine synthase n=1 Tax=Acinetobacter lwoffii TaxID=28090 RepID=UPI003F8EB7CE
MNKKQLIYLIAFLSGFLSLAQEILWMRLISFVGMSVPQTFSFTLALFLLGIALGAHIGKKICQRQTHLTLDYLGQIFLLAGVVDLLLICLVYGSSYYWRSSVAVLGVCVLACACVRGIVFPMVHHVGTQEAKTGAQISNVYFSNVFGSALAPLCISFIALDFLNTQQVYLAVCLMTLLLAALCMQAKTLKIMALGCGLISFWAISLPEKLFYEFSKNSYQANTYPSRILENRHGIIQVYDNQQDQLVFGANVYDGKFNTDLFHNTNGIDRAYLLTALKPQAEQILVIGLSTGSWAKVLSYLPNIKKMIIIEINPNYVELIKSHPEIVELLSDPRVEIITDDGRKWLKKNSQARFDLVLMNTTWNWRAYTSNLLSQDFIGLIKQRLVPDGIVFYNSTRSMNVYPTAQQVFPWVYQYKFMVLAAEQPQFIKRERVQRNLCALKNYSTQQAIFTSDQLCHEAATQIVEHRLVPYSELEFTSNELEVITDDNMITEFKYGLGL